MVAQALSKSEVYCRSINQVITAFNEGNPLTDELKGFLNKDLLQHEQLLNSLKHWYRISKEQGAPQNILDRIQAVGDGFKTGQPIPEEASKRMMLDFSRIEWKKLNEGVKESTPERHTIRVAMRALQREKSHEEILNILQFDPTTRSIQSFQGNEAARQYSEKALKFAQQCYEQQHSLKQNTTKISHRI